MATIARPLTKEEFRERYAGEKPYYEYWFGEAVQKSMPTWLHSILQGILVGFLKRAGYRSGSELELHIDPNWEPVPDVVGVLRKIEGPYPTEAVDVVIEILSPKDQMTRVLEKCHQYSRIGILSTFLIDPEGRKGWFWNARTKHLEETEAFLLPNERTILLKEVLTSSIERSVSSNLFVSEGLQGISRGSTEGRKKTSGDAYQQHRQNRKD